MNSSNCRHVALEKEDYNAVVLPFKGMCINNNLMTSHKLVSNVPDMAFEI